jgi:hypothetical protein
MGEVMSEFDLPAPEVPVQDNPTPAAPVPTAPAPAGVAENPPALAAAVDPVRAAAGRLGAQRLHQLAEFGKLYEQEHGLKPGRQRQRQLVQLGKRYELEHGLRAAKPRRKPRGDAWAEFLAALARVVKPAHRRAVERLVAALSQGGNGVTPSAGV